MSLILAIRKTFCNFTFLNNKIVPKIYEDQKQEILEFAENKFGKDYFDILEKLSQDLINEDDTSSSNYTLTVNHQGAFYASKK